MADSIVEQLFESLKAAPAEIGAELNRLGKQGANELAAALFSGSNAFVQYGPGQQTAEPEKQPEVQPPENDHSIER